MVLSGKIIKLLGGFYYVLREDGRIEETRARGVFRHQDIKPLVGDNVLFSYGEGEELSYIEEVLDRKNQLLRPPVANVDQILLFVPVKSPKYNLYLVDKLIAYYESMNVDILIVVSKTDLNQKEAEMLYKIYKESGFKIFLISENEELDFPSLQEELENKTTALAGVSGAGKSTFTNRLLGRTIETQSVSKKTDRGRHTTRHTELMAGKGGIFLFDTPGFSSMDLSEVESSNLDLLFREFIPLKKDCKFIDCNHLGGSHCGIVNGLSEGKIMESRYKSYVKIFEEIVKKERDKWR